MTWFEQITKTTEQNRRRMSLARTPETRARISRWSRLETVGDLLMLPGIFAIFAAPVATVIISFWFAFTDSFRADVFWWIWGVAIGVFALTMTINNVASAQRLKAMFADAHVSVGRIDKVITTPGSGDEQTTHDIIISAEVTGPEIIHRKLGWNEAEDPHRWVGKSIRFRHNTLDPENHLDAFQVELIDQLAPKEFRR